MSKYNSKFLEIKFFANKVHVHRWPLNSLEWSESVKKQFDHDLNKNKEKKIIVIQNKNLLVENYNFVNLKKIGLTIPLFKKQVTLIFEAKYEQFYSHVHITSNEEDYLQIFIRLNEWRNSYFSKTGRIIF